MAKTTTAQPKGRTTGTRAAKGVTTKMEGRVERKPMQAERPAVTIGDIVKVHNMPGAKNGASAKVLLCHEGDSLDLLITKDNGSTEPRGQVPYIADAAGPGDVWWE